MLRSSSTLLNEIRLLMKSKKYVEEIIDAYLIPTTDPHRNEYVADRYKRREFLSKFSGSNGTALITDRQALLWTDGRYFQQAEVELDRNCWTLMKEGFKDVPNIHKWIIQNLEKNCSIGFDPELISIDEWKQWKDLFDQSNLQLIPIETNFVDLIWKDERPSLPSNQIWSYPIRFAGLSFLDKLDLVRSKFNENHFQHLILHRTDDIAWLFNLRGGDIPFNPVFLSFAIISLDSVQLFLDQNKLSSNVKDFLEKDQIEIYQYEEFYRRLKEFHQNKDQQEKFAVSSSCNYAVQRILPQNQLIIENDLVYQLKAKKNPSEIEAMRRAHIKDSVALCSYFHWLENHIDQIELTECSGAEKLKSFRSEQDLFLDESFECISAVGSHGSIIHYRPRKETDRKITKNDLYLVDSGGQYIDGTTDVTRTIHLGQPNQFEKECFTRVLKGMIKLSSLKFPPQTIGARLDSFARYSLWEVGLDYQHGTGHGVGCCLNVHEGPQSIGTRIRSETFLIPGMILSDEPGVYLEDQFGIRIENLVLVKTIPTKYGFYNEDWLTFEHLTLVPIQLKLIDRTLLTDDEIEYLNNYHQRVRIEIGNEMKEQGKDLSLIEWLERNTEKI